MLSSSLILFFLTFFRQEVDDFFAAIDAVSAKRNALSIFKIARKLLFILGKDDKLVSITKFELYTQRPLFIKISTFLLNFVYFKKAVVVFLHRDLKSFVEPY